jgi:hypothetical protein
MLAGLAGASKRIASSIHQIATSTGRQAHPRPRLTGPHDGIHHSERDHQLHVTALRKSARQLTGWRRSQPVYPGKYATGTGKRGHNRQVSPPTPIFGVVVDTERTVQSGHCGGAS